MAQSTGAPVNLLYENGVVNVHPATVFVKSEELFTEGKNWSNSVTSTGIFEHKPSFGNGPDVTLASSWESKLLIGSVL